MARKAVLKCIDNILANIPKEDLDALRVNQLRIEDKRDELRALEQSLNETNASLIIRAFNP